MTVEKTPTNMFRITFVLSESRFHFTSSAANNVIVLKILLFMGNFVLKEFLYSNEYSFIQLQKLSFLIWLCGEILVKFYLDFLSI